MKIWFDTEFQEDGKTIELISIGMINEKGQTLYLENAEYDINRADDWLKANVIPHLYRTPNTLFTRKEIAEKILKFAGPEPEFWAYYADYDWVVLCQLYGRMIDLPRHWPKYCRDLKQLACNVPLPKQVSTEHHALADAIWNKDAYRYLEKYLENTSH
jgi:hypothetical protein